MISKEKNIAEDNQQINTNKEIELKYWSVVLKSNPAEIKQVVQKTGNRVAAVKEYLHGSRFQESDYNQL